MKNKLYYLGALWAFTSAVALIADMVYDHSQAQIGPYSGPGGSQPTAPLQPPVGGAAVASKTTASPAATSSTTAVMCGCAVSVQPGSNGIFVVTFSGSISNNTASDGATVQVAFGSGTPPANGAAAAGTTLGAVKTLTNNASTAALVVPFSVTETTNINPPSQVSPVWFDLQFKAVTGGSVTLTGVDGVAAEQ